MQGRKRLARTARALPLWLAAVIVAAILACASSAAAASNIEGLWSFNGGDIAIQPLSNGTFVGTVVVETKFAECTHPAGQQIWTGITAQSDGSFWGLHQWYESPNCTVDPTLGPTAYRVQTSSDGARYLKVCLSVPGTSQPTITSSGTEQGVTYGCVDSALIASLPTTGGVLAFRSLVALPSAKKCLSRRSFQIHVHDPKRDAFKKIAITIRNKSLVVVRHGAYSVATVNLKGLRPGSYTVVVRATTVLGRHLLGRRTYHTCATRRASKKHHRASSHHKA